MRKIIFSLLVPLLVFTTNQPNLVLHKRYIYGFVNILISFGQHFQRHLGWLNHFPKGTRLTLPVTSTWPSCIDICTRRERMWKPRYISPVTAAFIWSLTRWRRWWRWSRQWRRWPCSSTRPTWALHWSERQINNPAVDGSPDLTFYYKKENVCHTLLKVIKMYVLWLWQVNICQPSEGKYKHNRFWFDY